MKPKVNLSAAHEFLKILGNGEPKFTFQTFDDNADRRDPFLTTVLNGTLDQHADQLAELNARGAGIFVTVQKTDGKGRKKENIAEVRAVYQEVDDE